MKNAFFRAGEATGNTNLALSKMGIKGIFNERISVYFM
jgi:hypothetical protein